MLKLCEGHRRRARFSLVGLAPVIGVIAAILVIAPFAASAAGPSQPTPAPGATGLLPAPTVAPNSAKIYAQLTPYGAQMFANGTLEHLGPAPAPQAVLRSELGPPMGPYGLRLTPYGQKLLSEGIIVPVSRSSSGSGSVSPDSHSGCSGNTCIVVYGSGEEVDSWDTYADLGAGVCGHANFYIDDNLYEQTSTCYRGNTPKIFFYADPFKFTDGKDHQLCNQWTPGGTGYPCATVHP